ncbi:GNAT family N-acetyltransferase [Chloroflexi bacterium TSY]|nr:GNAT family N-acetyltransferase [Chloroflexi bacterium TSY]
MTPKSLQSRLKIAKNAKFGSTEARFTMIRQFNPKTDIPPYLQLRDLISAADGTNRTFTEEDVHQEISEPNQNPEEDRWIAVSSEEPQIFQGYSHGYHTVPERYLAWVQVHPAWQRRGIGSELLACAVARGHQLGMEHVLIYADEEEKAAQRFLERNGFKSVSHLWMMSALAHISPAQPEWPQGYTGRSFAETPDYAVLQSLLCELW